jgi:ferredoxin
VRVRIDRDLCSGHGRCYALAPALFVGDDDGYGWVVSEDDLAPCDEESARRAAINCPERAITIMQ